MPFAFEGIVLPKVAATQAVVGVALVSFVIVSLRAGVRHRFVSTVVTIALALLVLATLLSVAPSLSVGGTYGRWEGLPTVAAALLGFWVASQTFRDEMDLDFLTSLVVWSAYVAAVWAIIGVSVFPEGAPRGDAFRVEDFPRATGPLGNPNALGQFLALTLPLSVAQQLRAGRADPFHQVRTATIALALLLSFSRLAWVAGLVGTMIVLARASRRVSTRDSWTQAAAVRWAVAAIGAAVAAGTLVAGDALLVRVASIADGSFGTRVAIWNDVVRMVTERPFLGFGPDTFALAYADYQSGDWGAGGAIDRAHSGPLQLIVDLGLVFAASATTLAVVALRSARRLRSAAGGAIFGALVAYLVGTAADIASSPVGFVGCVLAGAAIGADQTVLSTRRSVATLLPIHMTLAILVASALVLNSIRTVAADAAFWLSIERFEQHAVPEALDLIQWSIRIAPERPEYHAQAGEYWLASDDLQAARSEYRVAAELGSSDAFVFRRIAQASLALGDADEARLAAERGWRANRFDVSSFEFLQHIRRQ